MAKTIIRLTENELQQAIYESIMKLCEDFNYHFGKEHNGKPYYSDNKFMMVGRDTGHFGSGTYFSTYKFDGNKDIEQYSSENPDNPQFIKIRDGVYRVNLDFYKNLYRVPNEQYGNVLYTTLENVNNLYNRVANGDYNCAKQYQIIKANCSHIGLKCPSYKDLMRMAQEHASKNSDIRSFSTVFMEMNGYNGVNVSGIFKFDNTLHGSVIYDLSKVDGDMTKADKGDLDRYRFNLGLSNPHNSVVYDDESDYNMMALNGQYEWRWVRRLNEMNPNEAKRALKNYTDNGQVLEGEYLEMLDEPLLLWYLRYLYGHKNKNTDEYDKLVSSRAFIDAVANYQLWYWLNYEGNSSVFVRLMQRFEGDLDWNISDKEMKTQMERYKDFLIGKMKRGLNYVEEKYLLQNKL